MKLVYKCDNCSNIFALNIKANDRGELNRNHNITNKCSNCNYRNKIKVNNVKAVISKHNKFIFSYALIINIIQGILFYFISEYEIKSSNSHWQYYAFTLAFFIPFLIAKVIIENDLKAVKTFNSYYV